MKQLQPRTSFQNHVQLQFFFWGGGDVDAAAKMTPEVYSEF